MKPLHATLGALIWLAAVAVAPGVSASDTASPIYVRVGVGVGVGKSADDGYASTVLGDTKDVAVGYGFSRFAVTLGYFRLPGNLDTYAYEGVGVGGVIHFGATRQFFLTALMGASRPRVSRTGTTPGFGPTGEIGIGVLTFSDEALTLGLLLSGRYASGSYERHVYSEPYGTAIAKASAQYLSLSAVLAFR